MVVAAGVIENKLFILICFVFHRRNVDVKVEFCFYAAHVVESHHLRHASKFWRSVVRNCNAAVDNKVSALGGVARHTLFRHVVRNVNRPRAFDCKAESVADDAALVDARFREFEAGRYTVSYGCTHNVSHKTAHVFFALVCVGGCGCLLVGNGHTAVNRAGNHISHKTAHVRFVVCRGYDFCFVDRITELVRAYVQESHKTAHVSRALYCCDFYVFEISAVAVVHRKRVFFFQICIRIVKICRIVAHLLVDKRKPCL